MQLKIEIFGISYLSFFVVLLERILKFKIHSFRELTLFEKAKTKHS